MVYNEPKVMRSVLSPKYLKHVLAGQYSVGSWDNCTFWLRGLNDTYRVQTEKGIYILRVYRTEVTEADVLYELSVLSNLQSMLAASPYADVAEAITKTDESQHTVVHAPEGPRMAVLFRHVDGVENVLQDEASCHAFGQSAAELHAAMDRVEADLPRYDLDLRFLIDDPLERIVNYIGEQHVTAAFLRAFAEALKGRIVHAASQSGGLDWGLCHGDMHGNNNAFQQGGKYVHYDFEWSAMGWRAYDLAQVKIRKRQAKEDKLALWQAFMAGYRSVRDFSAADEQAVDLFAIARRFWVMGLDVAFIESDMGALDYGEDWLNDFVEEFRSTNIVQEPGHSNQLS